MDKLERTIFTALLTPIQGNPTTKFCTWGLPLLLWGHPGIGKSDRISGVASALELPTEIVFSQTIDPTDISGISMPDPRTGDFVQKTLIPQIRRIILEGKGVLFLDEINGGTKSVQRALMGVVLARKVGDDTLPGQVRILAAANPAESGAEVEDIVLPLANRMCHLEVPPPSPKRWGEWYLSQGVLEAVTIEQGEEQVSQGWQLAWSQIQGLFHTFLTDKKPELLHKMPDPASEERERGWPSPRSWVMASRALATNLIVNHDRKDKEEIALTLLTGCVGKGAAVEYMTWAKSQDLPNAEELLRKGMKLDGKRLDRVHTAYATMISFLTGLRPEQKPIYAVDAWKRMSDLIDSNMGDLAMPLAKTLFDAGFGVKKLGQNIPGLAQAQSKSSTLMIDKGLHGYI